MHEELKDDKNKKKEARKALLLFFNLLKRKCGSFKKADEWYNFLKLNLDPIVSSYKDQIPAEIQKNFSQAKNLTDQTQGAINKACGNLKWNVEKVIRLLPRHSPLVKILLIAVALTSGVAAAVVLFINVKTVTIVIKNKGCDAIRPIIYLPIKIPGLKLFETPIYDGESGQISLFPIPITVDATQKGTLKLGLLGIFMPFSQRETIGDTSDIIFNGDSLIGRLTSINLSEKSTHELIISCK